MHSRKARAIFLPIHMAINLIWVISCFIMMIAGLMSRSAWTAAVFHYIFTPVTMLSVMTGLMLLLVTRWKLAKQLWLILKYAIASAMMVLTNVSLRPAINGENDTGVAITTGIMLLLLATAAVLSFRKPQLSKRRSSKRDSRQKQEQEL